jgi:hypothetical protein
MRKIIMLTVLLSTIIVQAQEDKTVILTVSGTGKTIEEAKTNALRSAIEQAFGAFISSKTEILNDNLVKDEIVSVANGNIQKFEIISQVEIPNNGYAMTLNATVSISKLTSFAQSKGVSIEVKGGLFAANIIQQELNEKAELISIENILNTSNEILKKSFDYFIETKGNPTLNNGKYDIPLKVTVKLNKNFYQFRKYFINSLSGLTMNESEIINYEEIKKPIGQLIIRKDTISYHKDMLLYERHGYVDETVKVNVDDVDNFNENLEKAFYCGQKSFGSNRYMLNFNDCFEILSKKKLKEQFKRNNFWSASPVILYKIDINDKGYSKIFFRNESSMELLNEYFGKLGNIILNLKISNNFELIDGKDLLKMKKNTLENDFKINLYNSNLYNTREGLWVQDVLKSNNNNYIYIYSEDIEHFSNLIYKSIRFYNEYFPNLLSILPVKNTSKNILASFSKFKEGDVITTICFTDTKSLEEIKQITEYKIKSKD